MAYFLTQDVQSVRRSGMCVVMTIRDPLSDHRASHVQTTIMPEERGALRRSAEHC